MEIGKHYVVYDRDEEGVVYVMTDSLTEAFKVRDENNGAVVFEYDEDALTGKNLINGRQAQQQKWTL